MNFVVKDVITVSVERVMTKNIARPEKWDCCKDNPKISPKCGGCTIRNEAIDQSKAFEADAVITANEAVMLLNKYIKSAIGKSLEPNVVIAEAISKLSAKKLQLD